MAGKNVLPIQTQAGTFKSVKELKAYCDAQYRALQNAQNKIKYLEDKIHSLESMLESAIPPVEPQGLMDAQSVVAQVELKATQPIVEGKLTKFIVSKEQALCEMQLEQLYEEAKHRQLTLEETKRMDLLVKNLYLAKEKNAVIQGESKPVEIASEAILMQIASTPEPINKESEE